MDPVLFVALLIDSAIRLAVPLLFAALAGLFSERSGIFDIGLEGKMLAAAFAAGAAGYVTGSPWLGLGAAVLASVTLALLHGLACITYRGNQIVSGVAINILAVGLTAQLALYWFAMGGQTPQTNARFLPVTLPGAETLLGIPLIGPLYAEVVSGQNLLVYIAFAAVPLTWWVVFRSRFGLRLRAVGENPEAADTAGVSVAWTRYRAVICCGVLCGFAGTYLALAQSAGFLRDMSAGKGFIALAALIFAKWRPVPAMWACLLFGFLEASADRLQGVALPGIGQVPVQAIQAAPYALTVILLAGFIGRATPPRAGGVPYVKER